MDMVDSMNGEVELRVHGCPLEMCQLSLDLGGQGYIFIPLLLFSGSKLTFFVLAVRLVFSPCTRS